MNTFEVKDIIEGKKSLGDCCKINMERYSTIYYYSNATNCKLCTFEYLGQIFRTSNEGVIKNFHKILMRTGNKMFFTHVTDENTVKNISKHYKLIYCQQVPLGYGSGMQYHCAFLINPKDPVYGKRVDDKNKYDDITKSFSSIYNQNVDLLKQNVQKVIVEDTNVIEQFIIKASNEEINKLRSYKQPKRKKDLITKINNKV